MGRQPIFRRDSLHSAQHAAGLFYVIYTQIEFLHENVVPRCQDFID